MVENTSDFEGIGNSLLDHARDDAATSRHGVVDQLFPYIVQASKKMSARAISRFLEEKHGFRVSYVTIGKALRQPEKFWNLYFDKIEASARLVAEAYNKPPTYFISEPEKYQEMLEGKPTLTMDDPEDGECAFYAGLKFESAVAVLDNKWFCFDESTLEEARRYILWRLIKPPKPEIEEA